MILLENIAALKLEQPFMRRRFFHLSCDNWDPEVGLFLVCSWDFFHGGQNGMKVAGFEYVFFRSDGGHVINLRSGPRSEAITMLHAPNRRDAGIRDARTGHTSRPAGPGQSNTKAMIALNHAFSSYMESGETVRRWKAEMAANRLPVVSRQHTANDRRQLEKLKPYWTDSDIERLVGR